jgi:NAD-dependent SIR2 family protein deacetylase
MKPYFPSKKEQSQIQGKFRPRRPKSRKEEQEFGPGKIDVLICPHCRSVYYGKSWKRKLKNLRFKQIKLELCPACQMIKDKKFEGELILENIPERFKEEIKRLIKNFGKRASLIDPQDRIISVEEKKIKRPTAQRKRGAKSRKEFEKAIDLRILTTENQLAQRLAKKIKETFGGKLKPSISHSHQESTTRIKISF